MSRQGGFSYRVSLRHSLLVEESIIRHPQDPTPNHAEMVEHNHNEVLIPNAELVEPMPNAQVIVPDDVGNNNHHNDNDNDLHHHHR